MRSVLPAGLFMVLVFAIAGVIMHSSCKKTDNCAGVVCQHNGKCGDGFCMCPSGVGGDTCQTIFCNLYDNKYAGSANVNTAHIGYTLIFSVPATTTSFLSMSLSVVKSSNGSTTIPVLPVVLNSTSTATNANFNITPTTVGGFTYSGTGILYAKQASLTLYKTPAAGADTTYICTNFNLVP